MTRAGDTPARAGSSGRRDRLASLQGCFNQFICFSLRHLDYIAQTYTSYYNTVRPYQSLGRLPLGQGSRPPPASLVNQDIGPVLGQA
ncbi:MAG: hypothetical protein CMJ49_14200 [Planctomycetaceae bacterium]|nr:hypothetical protein [Planctomycetaceae bacterium]